MVTVPEEAPEAEKREMKVEEVTEKFPELIEPTTESRIHNILKRLD
jgi:hypothetical protein